MYRLLLLALFASPLAAHAATFSVTADPASVAPGGLVFLYVSLETDTESINAFEGAIRLPPSLTLESIRYTGSLVPFWIEQPRERGAGAISFAGIFTGGYIGGSEAPGNLFTIVARATGAGEASVEFLPGTVAYANNGEGTPVTVELRSGRSVIDASAQSALTAPVDTTPPEAFVPVAVPGDRFATTGTVLVFIAQDKDSGVANYEIAHSLLPFATPLLSWREATSPYALHPATLFGFTYVRATDTAGNAVVAQAVPGGLARAYTPLAVILIVLAALVFVRTRHDIMKRR